MHRFNYALTGDVVTSAQVSNSNGCEDTIDQACSPKCRVIIGTAGNPAWIHVIQDRSDQANHVEIDVKPGVELQQLWVLGSRVDFFASELIVSKLLRVWTKDSLVQLYDVQFASADIQAKHGDIYLVDTKPNSREIDLEYRTPEGDMCIKTAGDTEYLEKPVWASNPMAKRKDCSLQAVWWAKKTLEKYDTNKDSMVSREEFQQSLSDQGRCCGSKCPFRSKCEYLENKLFPLQSSSASATYQYWPGVLSDREFFNVIESINGTDLVPKCGRRMTLTAPSAANPTRHYANLLSDSGGIFVYRAVPGEPRAGLNTTTSQGTVTVRGNTSFYVPQRGAQRVRMSAPAAKLLTKSLRDTVGEMTSTDHAFATLDVLRTPDIPRTRWAYATRPVYLELQPSMLHFLSAGLLNPPIQRYRVRIRDNSCGAVIPRSDDDDEEDDAMVPASDFDGRTATGQESALFKQLHTSLVPRFQLEMRGVIAELGPDHQPKPGTPDLSSWRMDSNFDVRIVPWNQFDSGLVDSALWLSFSLALLLAFGITALSVTYLRNALRRQHVGNQVRRKLVELKASSVGQRENREEASKLAAGGAAAAATETAASTESDPNQPAKPHNTGSKVVPVLTQESGPMSLTAIAVAGEDSDDTVERHAGPVTSRELSALEEANFNPFEVPLDVLTMVVVNPLKKKLLNSLRRFMTEFCVTCVPEATTTRKKPPRKPSFELSRSFDEEAHDSHPESTPSVLFDSFLEHYGDYCVLNNLTENTDKMEIQRELVAEYNLRIRFNLLQTLRGVQWRDPAALASSKPASPTPGSPAPPAVPVEDPAERAFEQEATELTIQDVVGQFLRKYCKVTCQYSADGLPFTTPSAALGRAAAASANAAKSFTQSRATSELHLAEHSAEDAGWYTRFSDFCLERNLTPPNMENTIAALGYFGVKHETRRVGRIVGLAFTHTVGQRGGSMKQLDATWFATEAANVLVHIVGMLALPMAALGWTLQLQWVHGITMSSPNRNLLTYYDFMQFPPDLAGKELVFVAKLVAIAALTFACAAILRLLVHYVTSLPRAVGLVVRKGFAALLLLTTLTVVTWLCCMLTWFTLAAALDPVRFLPISAGIIASVAAIGITWKAMAKKAGAIRTAVAASFSRRIQKLVSAANQVLEAAEQHQNQHDLQQMLRHRRIADGAGSGGAHDSGASEGPSQFSVADVFSLLNTDADEYVDRDEFDALFDKVGLTLSQGKKDQLFAVADTSGDGLISVDEFTAAWDYLEQAITKSALENLGLSNTTIATTLLWLVTCLTVLMAFLFTAIQAWENNSGFEAVIQTLLVSGSAGVTGMLRSKSKGEGTSKEQLKSIIDDMVAGAEN